MLLLIISPYILSFTFFTLSYFKILILNRKQIMQNQKKALKTLIKMRKGTNILFKSDYEKYYNTNHLSLIDSKVKYKNNYK